MNFSDVLLVPKKCVVASRSEVDISVKFGDHTFASPVMCANMKSLLTPEICKLFDENNWFYVYHRIDGAGDVLNFIKYANAKNFNVVSISIGLSDDYMEMMSSARNMRVDYVTIDIAHSHTQQIRKVLPMIKWAWPKAFVIVGNGCTPEWIEFLENLRGASGGQPWIDAAKVGIGVSNACRTRQYTGFGSMTATSLIDCSNAAKRIKLISDGGLTVTNNEVWIGDVAKAIRFGADMVMSGSLFSRCIDSPAIVDGYYGNASKDAKSHHNHIEGTTLKVETNGLRTIEMMKLISDSLKSSVSYGGGTELKDLRLVDFKVL